MPEKRNLQTTFIAGELDAKLALRVDTKQYANGARSLLNRRCLIGGGTSRRPGTRDLSQLPGQNRITEFVFRENEQYIIVFFTGGLWAFFPNGVFAGGFGGAPWGFPAITEMDFMQQGNTIIVTHFTFPPQVIERVSATGWTLRAITFFTSGPRIEQPYFKIAQREVTMQPSGYIGSINVIFSDNVLDGSEVGYRFRYLGREMVVTGVGAPNFMSANVVERLPPTFVLSVVDASVFTTEEVVVGSDSGARGVISTVDTANNQLTVYSRNANTGAATGPGNIDVGSGFNFDVTAVGLQAFNSAATATATLQAFTSGEILVGPAATSKITAVFTPANGILPVAVRDWDEALFTPGNGYPSCVALHRNRLCFAGHPKVPNLLMASRINNIYSFNIGTGADTDAILGTIGDASAAEIRQLFSADQLILGTDKGLYYCPEGVNAPFTPTRIAFIPFGSPWPISGSCKMRGFDDGVIAVSQNTVIKAKGTGDSNKTWTAFEVSILSPHLLKDPYDMAVTTNFEGGPERYCVFSNSDGTLTVMMLVEAQDIRNFVPWTTNGFFGSVCVVNKQLYCSVARPGDPNFHLERFENALTLDGVKVLQTGALSLIPSMFPAREAYVVTDSGYALGVYPLKMDDIPPGPYQVGDNYPTRIETLPVVLDDARGSNAGEMSRIGEAYVFTHESCRFVGNGYEKTAYRIAEDANLPPPRRTGPQRLRFLGWKTEPTITITQPDPLPLTVLGIKAEVFW